MTAQEISKNYNIPEKILNIYNNVCLHNKENICYSDADLEKLSLIMTLYDTGFSEAEINKYMTLFADGNSKSKECISMLENKRKSTLKEIHSKERQIENRDCLKYKIRNGGNKNE